MGGTRPLWKVRRIPVMDYNDELSAWDRLPVDLCEYRVLSNGAVLDIGRISLAVNAKLAQAELATVTEDLIEEASGYSPQYVMDGGYSELLADWMSRKPVLLCKCASGHVLLDGRRRALRQFRVGCDSIRAIIISEADAYKYGAAGGFGQIAPDGVVAERLLAATSKKPVGPHVLGVGPYVLGGARFVTDLWDKDGEPLGRGRRPERPERLSFRYHIIINALKVWFVSEEIRYRKRSLKYNNISRYPVRIEEIIELLFKNRRITLRDITDNELKSITEVTNYRDRKEFKAAFLSEINNISIEHLDTIRSEYIKISDILCRGEEKILVYSRGLSAIRRLASRKGKSLSGAELTRAMFGFLNKRDKNPIVIEDRLLLTRLTGIDFTEFYWDPACVRTIAAWWVVLHDAERGKPLRLSPQLAESFVLHRVILAEGGLVERFMLAWISLFQAFINIGQMEKIERDCADMLLDREYVRQWLESPAPDVEQLTF
jgi:hypothetical protein